MTMKTFRDHILELDKSVFTLDNIRIRLIQSDEDLWYATVQCTLAPGQEAFVNPAGFSIGRAYLQPQSNVPCIICKNDIPIGYIVFREWHDGTAASWSYYLDEQQQGFGYGRTTARLAVQILNSAFPDRPIKLSAEKDNEKAHRLYRSIGFRLSGETDGDDLIFVY